MIYFEIAKAFRIIVEIVILFVISRNIKCRRLADCEPSVFYCLLHRHLLVIAQIDALWQTGEVGAYVLAVESVDLIGCWVIGVG